MVLAVRIRLWWKTLVESARRISRRRQRDGGRVVLSAMPMGQRGRGRGGGGGERIKIEKEEGEDM